MSKVQQTDSYERGSASIVHDYLHLEPGEQLLIVSDETAHDISNTVGKTAKAAGATVVQRMVSTSDQRNISSRERFPSDLLRQLHDAQAVLTCISAEQNCTPFRKLLIQLGQRVGTRIAHMPGLTLPYLGTCFQANFKEMDRLNRILFRLLYWGSNCVITTGGGETQDPCRLNLNLGGIHRNPAQSGVVRDGSWCNIPGAEVYIAPVESECCGQILINGSLLGSVLKEPVTATFELGKMSSWRSGESEIACRLSDFENVTRGDPGWNGLCEFGIGLNDGFESITGVQLLDEKILGTIHIAIGDNTQFGGKNSASTHEDFVTKSPTVTIDKLTVIEDGRISVSESDYLEELSLVPPFPCIVNSQSLYLTGTPVSVSDGKLGIKLVDARMQDYFMQIGSDLTARKIADFWKYLQSIVGPMNRVGRNKIGSSTEVNAMLSLLVKYRLVEAVSDES